MSLFLVWQEALERLDNRYVELDVFFWVVVVFSFSSYII